LAELEPSSTAFVHVHHHFREDDQTLYAFFTREERQTFQALIAAHGVGPTLAMAILSTHTPVSLVDIVANGDLGALTLVPGVGKKTAERLLIELKGRLDLPSIERQAENGRLSDVREALIGLGYSDTEIRDALRELPEDLRSATDSERLLRMALSNLGARRA
jgi:Holliday junction DNA helicase RuvA